jgi:hypothetical protein
VGGVDQIAVRLQRRPRDIERLRRPAEIARHQRNLRFGHHTSRARDRFLGTKRPRRSSQQRFRPLQIAELRHRDPS